MQQCESILHIALKALGADHSGAVILITIARPQMVVKVDRSPCSSRSKSFAANYGRLVAMTCFQYCN